MKHNIEEEEMKAEIIIKTQKPSKETLERLYDVCNKIFKSDECFYSSTEIKKLKKEKSNIFL